MSGDSQHGARLSAYLSPLGAWAFALGTSIGWGSLVVTSNSYLLQAGPLGSVLGLIVGAAIMAVIARNYHYMINCFPDAGGAYTYTKEVFGHDFGFLTSWFVTLTYIAMFWANATSLPLFAHYFLGDMFKFGFSYEVFGYQVYLGEALLTIAAIIAFAALCSCSRKGIMHAMVVFALLICIGITVCFAASMAGVLGTPGFADPAFVPDKGELSQILLITCISPWAFIGFENISHSAEEFAFSRSKVFRIMLAAIVTATVLYIFLLFMSVSAFPPEYGSWLEYISDLGNLDGIEGLPPFYVARHHLGSGGVVMLMLVLLALVATSLVGNTVALSRLWHALAKDSVLPERFALVNKHGVPGRAIVLMACISLVIPFLGRTAVGWIVDVTTIGATIIYGFVSASAFKVARSRGDTAERVTGGLGVAIMLGFGAYLLVPVLFGAQTLEAESYFLFAVWGIVGFAFFRTLLARDDQRRFGRSTIVWIALLALVLFVTFVWMNQALLAVENETIAQVLPYYHWQANPLPGDQFVENQFAGMLGSSTRIMVVAAVLFALASAMLLSNFSYMSKWAQESEKELDLTREVVYTDPLTGLPSMNRFHDLAREGAAGIVASGERPVAVALDLVGMKDYHSKYGRDGSDHLLVTFANVLQDVFGAEACSRFAEDRFYAFAAEDEVAGKLEAVFENFKNNGEVTALPIRAGAYACDHGDDISEVGFDRARAACDLDRRTWESNVSWFIDGMDDEARLRLHVLDHVDLAIEQRWIRPYYQAVVRAATGEVCSEEALARWIDPEYGFLSPGQFIPILEDAGLLHKVDMHIVDCVIEDMALKRSKDVPVVPVSVNISLRDLGQLDVAAEIQDRVDAAGLPHGLLRIEFTESAASDNPGLFKEGIVSLRSNGFEVWMDDFGSGYSSLNVLKDFDFDVIKLDMEFMRNERSERTWDVIVGVVHIAQKLGMRVLAEGVETQSQAERLAGIGCDMLQGFYYTKPQPLEEIVETVEAGEGMKREVL